jgi:hypothetical protein
MQERLVQVPPVKKIGAFFWPLFRSGEKSM